MDIIFVGGGPSCVALLCYWIRVHYDWFLKQNITVIERTKYIGVGDLSKYRIRSNSVLPAFRHIIPRKLIIDPRIVSLLDSVQNDFCPLSLVSEMLSAVAESIWKTYTNVSLM